MTVPPVLSRAALPTRPAPACPAPAFLVLACLILAALGSGCTNKALGGETEGRDIDAAVGRNVVRYAPDERAVRPRFRAAYLDGSPASHADFAGSVTVVNVWASWCPPCREEQPVLERTWKKYRDRGVKFVGIDIRDTTVNAKAYLDEFGVTYPTIFDRDQRLPYLFRVGSPPSTFVLDRRGRVAVKIVGAVTDAGELDVLVDEVLEEA